ncbi:hypothetical protein [Phenylobacterium sp.]|uniref:hypothetical protein n=1 Tax=Phenylobacterium sp. TaxID=1871053 RepID=UPI00261976EC|nr:hypothetical protein [Phenylobacterium sp.]
MSRDSEWERCAPWLQSALDVAGNEYALGDVHAMLDAREATFWPGDNAAIVTRIEDHPGSRNLLFWLAGGDLDELTGKMRPFIEQWGAKHGCTRSIIIGRPGWERALPDYRPIARVIAKELTP